MPDETIPPAAPAPAPIDYAAKLLALLGLDTSADEAAVDAKLAELQGATTKAATVDALQAELDKIRVAHDELWKREQELLQAKRDKEADDILALYADRQLSPEATVKLRALLLSDRESAMTILDGLPKPAAAAPAGEGQPPAPTHNPGKEQQPGAPSEEEIVAKIKARAEELRAANPKLTRTDALTTAERQVRAGQ